MAHRVSLRCWNRVSLFKMTHCDMIMCHFDAKNRVSLFKWHTVSHSDVEIVCYCLNDTSCAISVLKSCVTVLRTHRLSRGYWNCVSLFKWHIVRHFDAEIGYHCLNTTRCVALCVPSKWHAICNFVTEMAPLCVNSSFEFGRQCVNFNGR